MAVPVVMWFRQDLRLSDNPALSAAVATGRPVIYLYILDDETPGKWAMGGASRWWLHHSLTALESSLRKRGGRLVLRRGRAPAVLDGLLSESGADTVFWNRCYEPYAVERDTAIKAALKKRGVGAESSNGSLLFEPWQVKTKSGGPFKVYTAFWNACRAAQPMDQLLPAPKEIASPEKIASDALGDWGLLPTKPNWARGFSDWTPGEDGAQAALERLCDDAIGDYTAGRDRPDQEKTSRLSPHLHFGEIGPRQVWRTVRDLSAHTPSLAGEAEKFLSEIGWREFSHHLLHQAPTLPEKCFREEFNHFPWTDDRKALSAWQKGQTGFPIVDAGMRQLWHTGWMHNRVRMIVASLLVKHLLVPWQRGAAWFWDTLVDADLASNSANWQWVAGCGADAAPYFRIFNPVLQGEKFDPDGDYVRKWVPELAAMPKKFIHKPWEAGGAALREAGVRLGRDYPEPIIELERGRDRALSAFSAFRKAG